MGMKLPGRNAHMSPGYWGNDPSCRFQSQQVPEHILVLLIDKLLVSGRPVTLYENVDEDTPGSFPCTCDKDTTSRADYKCLSCYGHRFVPGYLKFQHETLFYSTAKTEVALYTLTGTERDLSLKPNRIRLSASSLSGTIETNDKPYSNLDGADWEFEAAVFRKTATDVIDVEFSTDAGATWTDITLINGAEKPVGAGSIRMRTTLTRSSLTTESPSYEIVRLRHVDASDQTDQMKGKVDPGKILLLRTQVQEGAVRSATVGRQTDFQADQAWTVPLDIFSKSITHDTPPAKLDDRGPGPHPFYETCFGIDTGQRFAVTQISWDEQLTTFTQQFWADRRTQSGELYGTVF